MRDTMTPEERLERVARLLVKAMYLSLGDGKVEGDGDECDEGADGRRYVGAEGYRESGSPVAGSDGRRRYGSEGEWEGCR